MRQKKKILSPVNIVMSALFLSLLIAALVEQLRRPSEGRNWHGQIAGIPYDFRFPTVERLRATFWNKNTSQILVPQVFGMGWSINFYPLIHPAEASKTLQ